MELQSKFGNGGGHSTRNLNSSTCTTMMRKTKNPTNLLSPLAQLRFLPFLLLLLWFSAPSAQADSSLRTLNLRARNLFPESFDWDAALGRILLGSAGLGTIWSVDPENVSSVQEFVRDEELAGKVVFAGLIVDRKRNRVVVAAQDVAWRFSALVGYDLDSRRRIFLARLDDVGVAPGEPSCANDVAVDFTTGDTFVTNCRGNFLWKVTPEGTPSVLVKHADFTSQPVLYTDAAWCGFNGIVHDQSRYLLAVQTNSGSLFRIDLHQQDLREAGVHLVRLEEPLVGGDGMVIRDDGNLVVVSHAKLWLLKTGDDWTSARVVDTVALNFSDYATGAATVRGATFIVHAHLGDLMANRTREEFEVVKVEFPSEEGQDVHPAWLVLLLVLVVGGVSLWRLKMGQFYQRKRD